MRVRSRAAGLVAGLLAGTFASCSGNVDGRFDVSVRDPAFRANGPRVLFDEAHHPHHRARGTYAPFTRLLENDGFRVSVNRRPIDAQLLRGADILAIVTAQGANDINDAPALTAAEDDVVRDWVAGGGALLLVFDHWPFGGCVQDLAGRFGVEVGLGSVEDPKGHDPATDDTGQLVFSRENGLLGEHPILRGRRADEAVERVTTFDGASVGVPAGAVTLLRLSDGAVDLEPDVQVDRSHGDVRANVTFVSPRPAASRAQGVAMEVGKGRVVILGESAMLTAQLRDGRPFGMNAPGVDNRQLALNLMRWLGRAF
ncbi:MAG: hypothetical protein U0167_15050 [bacterium]